MRASRVVTLAWLAYAIAWVVPVHKDGDRLPNGLPGWQALRVAMNPVWPYEGDRSEFTYWGLLPVASGLTNLVMVASLLMPSRRTRRQGLILAWASIVAVLLNAQWVLDKDWTDLRVGYYLWWGSFLALGVGLLRAARAPTLES